MDDAPGKVDFSLAASQRGDFVIRLRRSGGVQAVPPDRGVVLGSVGSRRHVQWADGSTTIVPEPTEWVVKAIPVEDAVNDLPRDDISARLQWVVAEWRANLAEM